MLSICARFYLIFKQIFGSVAARAKFFSCAPTWQLKNFFGSQSLTFSDFKFVKIRSFKKPPIFSKKMFCPKLEFFLDNIGSIWSLASQNKNKKRRCKNVKKAILWPEVGNNERWLADYQLWLFEASFWLAVIWDT